MQKTVKMTLKGNSIGKWANGHNIFEFEKEINPRGYSDPVLGLYTYDPSPFSLMCSLLLKDLSFNFYLLLLQLVLCRVAALKSLPVHHP